MAAGTLGRARRPGDRPSLPVCHRRYPPSPLVLAGGSGGTRLGPTLPLEHPADALGEPAGGGPITPPRVRLAGRSAADRPLDGRDPAGRAHPPPHHVRE